MISIKQSSGRSSAALTSSESGFPLPCGPPSVVWRCFSTPHRAQARDETARRRFEREAKAAASLSHPNVVEVFRFGVLPDETPFLVMRFIKGRTMEERLKAEGRLPSALARQVLLEVASALAAAHANGGLFVLDDVSAVDNPRYALFHQRFGSFQDDFVADAPALGSPEAS